MPDLSPTSVPPAELEVDALVLSAAPGPTITSPGLDAAVMRTLEAAAQAIGFGAEADATARIPAPEGLRAASVLLIGMSPDDDAAPADRLRRLAGTAVRSAGRAGSLGIAFPHDGADQAEAIATGALLGAHRPARRSDATPGIEHLIIASDDLDADRSRRARVIARTVIAARALVNEPANRLTPETFAEQICRDAAALPSGSPVSAEVMDAAELRERGFGGLTGVGGGSAQPPSLIRLDYRPADARAHLALVGKGITFDTGGISIKPADRMHIMKSDMAGAAAAAQALLGIAELGLPVRVTAWLAMAENMPSGTAMRPGDVLEIYGGQTVEIINTDAEGRLVLADALVAAQEEEPDLLVDLATLTGAQVAALGLRTSGVMGTAEARAAVIAAAEASGEPMWPMPIPPEVRDHFRSEVADLANAGGRGAGMLAAAAFLRHFISPSQAWAHLDIAGPAINSASAHGFTPLGGTGAGVATMIRLAESLAESAAESV